MQSADAKNLIADPGFSSVRNEMIRMLGAELQKDPRWIGYWAEFRIARYSSLPKSGGDMQLFTKSSS